MNNDDYQKYLDELKEYINNAKQDQAELLLEIADLKIQNYSNENKIQHLKDALSVLFNIVKDDHPTLDLSNFHSLIK